MEGNQMKSKKRIQPSTDKAKRRVSKHLEQINLYAAGIDIGSQMHYVAVPAELDDQPVRSYSWWLVGIGISTVAEMEFDGTKMAELSNVEHVWNAQFIEVLQLLNDPPRPEIGES